MKKPIIGLSGSIIVETDGMFPGYRRSFVNEDYIQAVIRAGGVPLLLPITSDLSLAEDMIAHIDGLILTGGHDVNPIMYNEEPDILLSEILPERDFFDAALIKYADANNIPILGICRGMQLINIHYGGTLYQDNSRCDTSNIKHSQGHSPSMATHTLFSEKNSFIHGVLGDSYLVNSFHHQSVKDLANGFKITAKAKDGMIEAIERIDSNWCVGLQFHPEMMASTNSDMQHIFNAFVENVKSI